MTSNEIWVRRRERANELSLAHPHSTELMRVFSGLLDLQVDIFDRAGRSGWGRLVEEVEGVVPRLKLRSLPRSARNRAFQKFVKKSNSVLTDVLSDVGKKLEADVSERELLLELFLDRKPVESVVERLQCSEPSLSFFPRAFFSPVAQALRSTKPIGDVSVSEANSQCPYCGWFALCSILKDGGEIRGQRLLMCSLCSAEWQVARTGCPSCGETSAEALEFHVSESWPHVRVEECRSCRKYLKGIDLRQDGLAEPVVDELASVDLDLWAVERGLQKHQTNVFGL